MQKIKKIVSVLTLAILVIVQLTGLTEVQAYSNGIITLTTNKNQIEEGSKFTVHLTRELGDDEKLVFDKTGLEQDKKNTSNNEVGFTAKTPGKYRIYSESEVGKISNVLTIEVMKASTDIVDSTENPSPETESTIDKNLDHNTDSSVNSSTEDHKENSTQDSTKSTAESKKDLNNSKETTDSSANDKAEKIPPSTRTVGITISASPDPIATRNQVDLTVNINGNAGDIVNGNGNVEISIPKNIVGDLNELKGLQLPAPYSLLTVEDRGGDYVLVIKLDTTLISPDENFDSEFHIKFTAGYFDNTDPNMPKDATFNVDYAGQHDDDTVEVEGQNPGAQPIFYKDYYGATTTDDSGAAYGVLSLNTQPLNNNRFIIMVHYNSNQDMKNAVVTDTLPVGTSLAPNPSSLGANGDATPIAGGIRIIKVSYGSTNNFEYVSQAFINKVSYDPVTRKITVNLGDLGPDDHYAIEYALNVDDPTIGRVYNQAELTTSNNINLNSSYPLGLDENEFYSITLTKKVDKPILNVNENTLEYELKIHTLDGSVEKGRVIEDVLDSRLSFLNWVSYDSNIFQVSENNGKLSIVLKEDIPSNSLYSIKFKVDASNVKSGEKVQNQATIDTGEKVLTSNIVETKRIEGMVQVTKVDEDGKALSGATFELMDPNGNVLDTKTTDASGTAIFGPLSIGNYVIKEKSAPFGYILDSTEQSVTINEDTDVTIQLKFVNKIQRGSVTLKKVDDNTKDLLKDAIFELQDENGNVIASNLTTDINGIIKVDDLLPGKYQFVEIQAPDGYILDKTPIPFEIIQGQIEEVKLEVTNKLFNSGVVLNKVDEETGKQLQGAVFELQDSNGNVIASNLVTDINGMISVDNLLLGTYQFVEVQAPDGYILDKTPIPFEIVQGQIVEVKVEVTNKLFTSGVVLSKVDEETGKKLEGAIFELQDSNGNVIASNLTTDINGMISVDDLLPGTYQFVEIQAPDGYELNRDPLTFEITKDDSEFVQVVKKNKKVVKEPETTKPGTTKPVPIKPVPSKPGKPITSVNTNKIVSPKTGDNSGLYIIVFMALNLVSGMLIYKMRKKHKRI